MSYAVRKAVFPVGGLGTRFLPATKSMPKEMLPIVDKPLIQHVVEEARAAGIEEFIFVTGRGKSAIEDHFDCSFELNDLLEERGRTDVVAEISQWLPSAGTVAYTRQQEPLGLGHAVWCARNLVGDEPFAVLLADDLIMADPPCLSQMVDTYRETGGNLVAVMEVEPENTSRYGILDVASDRGDLVEVQGLVEKPASDQSPSNLAIIGRYILRPEVFEFLGKAQRGAGDEIQLTDALASMLGSIPFFGYRYSGIRYDCGDKVGFLHANISYALARPDMAEDVRIIIRDIAGKL
jgi:UTP--glucose-1-phosphate uridylyltransferase